MRWHAFWNWKLVRSGFFCFVIQTHFLVIFVEMEQSMSFISISNESFYIGSWKPRAVHSHICKIRMKWQGEKTARYNSHNRQQLNNYWFHIADLFSCVIHDYCLDSAQERYKKEKFLILNSLTLSWNGISNEHIQKSSSHTHTHCQKASQKSHKLHANLTFSNFSIFYYLRMCFKCAIIWIKSIDILKNAYMTIARQPNAKKGTESNESIW